MTGTYSFTDVAVVAIKSFSVGFDAGAIAISAIGFFMWRRRRA